MHDHSSGDPTARDFLLDFADFAQRYLSRWIREGVASGKPIDMRDFKFAIAAMCQLADAREKLEEKRKDERATDDGERSDPEEFNRRVLRAIGKGAFDDEADDDAGALPE